MVDFRFFIISIVAVFLALGLGIVLGSAFLGDPILQTIERRVQDALGRNAQLEEEILDLEAELDRDQEFMSGIETVVVDGSLVGAAVVVIDIEGTDGGLTDAVRGVVEEAGGEVASEVRVTEKVELSESADQEVLARTLATGATEPEELRTLLGRELGDALVALRREEREVGSSRAAEELIDQLVDLGYVSLDSVEGDGVPQDAAFVIAAGGSEAPLWPIEALVESLGSSLAQARVPVVAAETSDSAWGVVAGLRDGDVADAPLSTVDNAETTPGRIAVALALDLAPESTGHWGIDDGAAGPVPTPID